MKLTAFMLIITFPFISAGAISFYDNFSWAVHGSIFYFAADNGIDSDPAPILPSFGLSAAWNFWGPLRVELTEDIYMTNYQWNNITGHAMACDQPERSAFVTGFLTALQLTAFFPFTEKGTTVRVYGGPGADFRVVSLAFGLNHGDDFTGSLEERDPRLETDAIRNYFWSEGRWFYPVAGVGIDFPVNERFLLGFDMRTWFPMYRLWTDEHLPKIDGWRFGIGFRITRRPLKIPSGLDFYDEHEPTPEEIVSQISSAIESLSIENANVIVANGRIVIRLDDVQFLPNSAELSASEGAKLADVAQIINDIPGRNIIVSGYAAMAGTEEGRQQISHARAQAVADYLVQAGARRASEITVEGRGAAAGDYSTAEGMASARRVEITILD